jgi:hypothetical protein
LISLQQALKAAGSEEEKARLKAEIENKKAEIEAIKQTLKGGKPAASNGEIAPQTSGEPPASPPVRNDNPEAVFASPASNGVNSAKQSDLKSMLAEVEAQKKKMLDIVQSGRMSREDMERVKPQYETSITETQKALAQPGITEADATLKKAWIQMMQEVNEAIKKKLGN